jgi:hypothetical protein
VTDFRRPTDSSISVLEKHARFLLQPIRVGESIPARFVLPSYRAVSHEINDNRRFRGTYRSVAACAEVALMRRRHAFQGVCRLLLILTALAVGAVATSGDPAPRQQWAMTWVPEPTMIGSRIVEGPVLFSHDEARMRRGEPCTSVYLFDRLVSLQADQAANCEPVHDQHAAQCQAGSRLCAD